MTVAQWRNKAIAPYALSHAGVISAARRIELQRYAPVYALGASFGIFDVNLCRACRSCSGLVDGKLNRCFAVEKGNLMPAARDSPVLAVRRYADHPIC